MCLDIDIDASHNSEWMMALTYLGKRVRAAANTSSTSQFMHVLRVLGVCGSWSASAGLFTALWTLAMDDVLRTDLPNGDFTAGGLH